MTLFRVHPCVGTLLTLEQRRPIIFSVYAIVHTVTLVMLSGILFLNALPTPIASVLPLSLHQLRYTEDLERSMCREDGFGWDEHWLDQCRSGFAILSTGAIWVGLAMMVAHWWAVSEIWSWLAWRCNKRQNRESVVKFGKASFLDEKTESRISKEV
jgi:hypothetical protein